MVLIVASFEGDDEKAQYANFKHISFNGCLGLTFFTKLVIDCVYRHDNEILRGSTPLHLPYTIGDKIVETLYSNRVTLENKRIGTPVLSPPFKVGVFVVS